MLQEKPVLFFNVMKLKVILLPVFMAIHFPSAYAAITDDLAGHWTFDDTSGFTLTDSTPNANDGTLFNFPQDDSQWVPGKIGGALHFGGPTSLDYVIVPDYPKPAATMTISIWVWTDVRPSDWAMVINDWVGSCGQFHVGLFGGVDMANFTSPEPCAGTPPPTREGKAFPVGSWEHVAFVADGTNMRQYHNGQEVASIASDGTIYQPPVKSFGIGLKPNADGTGPGNTAWLWRGKMDDLGIWTRALSPQEIQSIYQAGLAGKDLTGAGGAAAAPRILTQPQGQSRFVGESFSLSMRAGGSTPLTYEWSKDGQILDGKTESTISFTEATSALAGSYKVEVRNAVGSILSDAAIVTVNPVAGISTGLAGHWKLDETSGLTSADSTTPANNGTLTGFSEDNSEWVPGQIAGALQFGGVDVQSYVQVPEYPKPDHGAMTVTAWVWNDVQEGLSFAVTPQFVGSWGNTSAKQQFRLGLQNDRLTGFIQTTGGAIVSAADATAFLNKSWQQIALVADGANLRVYRNGFEAANAPYTRQLAALEGPLNLTLGNLLNDDGSSSIAIPNAFFGKLDDVGLWGRALAPKEILAIYQAGLAQKDLSLASAAEVSDVKPTFSSQPQAATELFAGEHFSLSVQASGSAPLSYQWSKDGQIIAGATNKTYAVDPAGVSDSGSYVVVVSNSAGNITSSPAVVKVNAIDTITAGLVGHWTFDETQGTTLTDSTTNANHGTLGNFPDDNSQWVPGRIGGSLAFRGSSTQDYVVVPDYPKPNSTLAISVWVWTDVRPSDWTMVVNDWSGSCGQFHVGLFGGVDMANFMSTAGCANLHNTREGTPFPVGSWEHVAFVSDGQMLRQYHNGREVFKLAYDGTIYQPTVKSFGIGMKPNADGSGPGAFFWQGKMDDLGIWKRALSPDEITAIYNAGLAGKDLTKAAMPQRVSLTVVQSSGSITISWPATATGFVLESNTSLSPGTAWTPVPGVTVNSITLTAQSGNRFYRLRK